MEHHKKKESQKFSLIEIPSIPQSNLKCLEEIQKELLWDKAILNQQML